jgi:diacylglycerol kinase family enzyme
MLKSIQNALAATPRTDMDLPVVEPDPTRIAVLLNRNARQVNDRLARRVAKILGSDHLFYSRNLDDAESFTREMIQRGYGTILSGGGDGTLTQTINLVRRYVDESNAWRIERAKRFGESQKLLGMPRFGFLKLGTGNGLTRLVGAGKPLHDLKMIADFAPGRTFEMPLIQSGSQRFFFAGLGYDSVLLNDYNNLCKSKQGSITERLFSGLPGYMWAVLTRTVPRALLSHVKCEGRVVNRGKAFYIDPRRGDAAIELEPGSTLFEGSAGMIGVGTSPFYGYGFKVFPFANIMPKMMHLRISTLGPVAVLSHLRGLWRGHYRHPHHIMDFLVEDVGIELEQPFPFQHSGDAQGLKQNLDFSIASESLRLVDCHRPVLVAPR